LLIEHGANVKAMSDPDTKGNKAYVAPTARQRAINLTNDGIALDGSLAGARKGRQAAPQPTPKAPASASDDLAAADEAAAAASFGRGRDKDGGGLTPLVYAASQDCLECARILVESGADVNQTTRYGWSPLLAAIQNRHYKLSQYLLEHGANPNIANKGGWRPLYITTDNRNIESDDYPVRKSDMDHLAHIKLLLDHGADVNARVCGTQSTPEKCVGDNTDTRTNFTMQRLYEGGATPIFTGRAIR
jgi:hypothetical protein